ncbi:hypothetical protein ABZW11_07580 [Nonomuraea sp. NPDC004580]|uniref:glycine-rich domain-containing protein n=1 Tax=Nonomuraea sp. NPDC004580 TaxID=3154552 RepID=UPI0033A7B145
MAADLHPAASHDGGAAAMDALAYQAPFLIERLVKRRVAGTAEQAEALFLEAKKYIVLTQIDHSMLWQMYSLRVDEAWHDFILFTGQYMEFCHRYFGQYVHHRPSNAPDPDPEPSRPVASFGDFCARYAELFGSPPPDEWYDARNVTTDRRVLNEHAGRLGVHRRDGLVHLSDPAGDVLMTVNDLAHDALAFLARSPAFHVRELPGGLTDEEKIALVAALVEHGVLKAGG